MIHVLPIVGALLAAGCAAPVTTHEVPLEPIRRTSPVGTDADDPAFWVDADDPSRSLILATDKTEAPGGALYVFDLHGQVRQRVAPLDRPNNVDVEYGLATPAGPLDIAVVTERLQHRLRVYAVNRSGVVEADGGAGIPVLETESGTGRMPMGIALYRRPRDGAIFAIVAPKTGPTMSYLWQYRLEAGPDGVVRGTFVRRFGTFSGSGEIEAVAVDDELGYVYYADEEYGVHKWHADPDHARAATEVTVFARNGFRGQREGIAVVPGSALRGVVVVSDQIAGGSRLHLFARHRGTGGPHAHRPLGVIDTPADDTDGIDVVARSLKAPFSTGVVAMMNSRDRNFLLFDWQEIVRRVAR